MSCFTSAVIYRVAPSQVSTGLVFDVRAARLQRGDIAAALREGGGLPDPGNIENIDDFAACQITRKEDWVELYAKP